MLDFSIDTLSLYTDSHFTLTSHAGLDAPPLRVSAYENAGEDGGTIGAAFYGSRLVTLTGTVRAQDGAGTADYNQARRNLAYMCRIRKDSSGFPTMTPFSFTTLDGVAYSFSGQIKTFQIDSVYPTWGKFIITIVCPDPNIYGAAFTSGAVTRPSGGTVSFPLIFDPTFEFGTGTGGNASAYNYGNADAPLLITLRGVGSNPYIYSPLRGKNMKLNYTTTLSSDVIVIDMKNKTIVLNGSTSLLSYKDVDSDWFSAQAGVVSPIQFNTSSSSDGMTMEVTGNVAYVGI
ncbi:Phage tail protein [Arthrobacter sp. ok909]|uniref:phage distal tail protein n=1 Tax=Arthrobacter sp. ok909 TaxID=1761746 RepID=UPI000881291E|nr:phage tail domain-containing protein [Arthrobacter sp. ok909]SDP33031.1 Phage tail protein [Arthrobacter sp. ok909]